MEQLLFHLIGDYLTQSDWMAQNKTKSHLAAMVHAWVYSIPFIFIGAVHRVSWNQRLWDYLPLAVILLSHFFIDRYRLARYVVWAKNWMGPKKTRWKFVQAGNIPDELISRMMHGQGVYLADDGVWEQLEGPPTHRVPPFAVCSKTGYPPGVPDWMAVWLLIIADNTLHLAINYCALRWL